MVISHSYVSLPEGIWLLFPIYGGKKTCSKPPTRHKWTQQKPVSSQLQPPETQSSQGMEIQESAAHETDQFLLPMIIYI